MIIDINKEELQFLMRVCKRSIELATQLGDKCGAVLDPERSENIEKATKLYNTLESAYKVGHITERESVTNDAASGH